MTVILEKLLKRTWAEIDLDALDRNTRLICRAAPGKEIMAVVKANAYGHGVDIVAPELFSLGIRKYAVSNIVEALELRGILPEAEILIFGYLDEEWFGELLSADITQTVGSVGFARTLSDYAMSQGKRAKVHVKADTGMTRIGIDTPEELERIMALPGLDMRGVYTHFSSADSLLPADTDYTAAQEKKLREIAAPAAGKGIPVYSQNSGGILYHGGFAGEIVRAGIILYGCMPNTAEKIPDGFGQVMTLKARVCQIKNIKAGTAVSYGRTFTAPRDMTVAVIPAGYADGYRRSLSNSGAVYINGARCPICGRVCMDQMIVDVTGLPVNVGDTALLYSGDIPEITADVIADSVGTIGYELLCAVGARVPRVAVRGNK